MDSKQHKKKVILTSIAVGAAGVLGYFGWQYYKKRMQQKKTGSGGAYSDLDSLLKTSPGGSTDTLPVMLPATLPSVDRSRPKPTVTAPAFTPPSEDSEFPLRKGSKGEKVRQLQKALIAKYGKSILPKYGADGDFGSETAAALRKAKLPSAIDESTYNVLTQAMQSD